MVTAKRRVQPESFSCLICLLTEREDSLWRLRWPAVTSHRWSWRRSWPCGLWSTAASSCIRWTPEPCLQHCFIKTCLLAQLSSSQKKQGGLIRPAGLLICVTEFPSWQQLMISSGLYFFSPLLLAGIVYHSVFHLQINNRDSLKQTCSQLFVLTIKLFNFFFLINCFVLCVCFFFVAEGNLKKTLPSL